MYQKIYDAVEKRGRIKTGILLNGEDAGLKYLAEESSFFYPEGAERKKEAEELKNMDFQTAWTHTLKNAEFATSFVELLQEMLTGMDADDVIVSIDDLVDSFGGN